MREREIEKYLVQRTKQLGGEVRKVMYTGHRGAPDRLLMLPERKRTAWSVSSALLGAEGIIQETLPAATIWVELKAPGKKPEPHQIREHVRMRRMGQRVVVIDSMEGVDNLMKELDWQSSPRMPGGVKGAPRGEGK